MVNKRWSALSTVYAFIKHHMMKKISRDMDSSDTNTSRDYEYTDWSGIRHFTEEFLKNLVHERTQDSRGRE